MRDMPQEKKVSEKAVLLLGRAAEIDAEYDMAHEEDLEEEKILAEVLHLARESGIRPQAALRAWVEAYAPPATEARKRLEAELARYAEVATEAKIAERSFLDTSGLFRRLRLRSEAYLR